MTPQDDARAKLKPCPFCGGEAKDLGWNTEEDSSATCGSNVACVGKQIKCLKKYWNTRAVPEPSPDNMREAERLAELIFEWKDSRPSRDQIEIIADALQAKDEKFDAMITVRDDALLDAEAKLHASCAAAPVNAMREALEFYANARNYDLSVGQHGVVCSLIEIDNGEKAREALSSAPAIEQDGARIKKASWIIDEYIKDAVESSDVEDGPEIEHCTAEITVSDLRVVKQALASPAVEQESAWRDVLQKEAAYHCTYCADGREAEKHKGGWWHRVARGGDLGQLEPCKAHVVHSIRQRLIDTPPKPRIENP